MKKFKWLVTALLIAFASSVFASSNSNPGLYYGQVPTAAQWNSYFATKLDYIPGNANTIPYWDGSGNLLSAAVSGDCTAVANLFTCNTTSSHNLYGGALGSFPYQSAANTTLFLGGNAGTQPSFVTSTGTGAAAQAPTLTSSTGSGTVVLSTSPTVATPTITGTANFSGQINSTVITGTAPFAVASTTPVTNLSIGGNAATATTSTNLASGAVGSVPYQTGAGATTFLAGNTSTTPSFLTSTGTGAAAQAPTYTSSTGTGSVVLASYPTFSGGIMIPGVVKYNHVDTFVAGRNVNIGTVSDTLAAGVASTFESANTAASAFTVTIAAPIEDGERRRICFKNATGTITWTVTAPATATNGLPTTMAAGQCVEMVYNSTAGSPTNSAATTWYVY